MEPVDVEKAGNLCEAGLWCAVSASLLVRAIAKKSGPRRTELLLAATFFVFALSDLIEYRTGAWWRPPGLLLLKGGCILVFATCLYRHVRRPSRAN